MIFKPTPSDLPDNVATAHGNGNNTTLTAVSQAPRRSLRDHQTAGRGRGPGTSRPNAGNAVGDRWTSAQNHASVAPDVVNIIYWNIYHDFTLKLTDSEFHDVLREYDIMFFAETDMLPGEEEPADVPTGIQWSRSLERHA
ncbi:hypothetical protein B0H13DRAFT_2387774 [Mycena leptocephala]|nr:hypothetical protein B0H13DRAFT_2387774 [Mycena leptocephala]